MLGFLFAILTAIAVSIKGVFSKKSVMKMDEYPVSWSLRFFAFLFLAPLLWFMKIPSLGDQFWIALLIGGSLNAVTTVLFIKAIKHSDLSIVSPISTFTPLFLLITSPIIVGEFPGIFGLMGVGFIVIGSYVLNIKEKRNGCLAPFKALLKEKGAQLMLIVAFLWSITSNIDKIGVQNSSPVFWVIAINAFIAIVLFPIILRHPRKNLKQISSGLKTLVPIGLLSAIALVFQMIAISLILVIYVTSIKRISVVMSVLWGHLFFKEKNIKEKLAGVIIMIAGVFLITLLG